MTLCLSTFHDNKNLIHTMSCTQIANGSIATALTSLNALLNSSTEAAVDNAATVYLLSSAVNSLGTQIVEPTLSEVSKDYYTHACQQIPI